MIRTKEDYQILLFIQPLCFWNFGRKKMMVKAICHFFQLTYQVVCLNLALGLIECFKSKRVLV